ncbi:MAG TPA: hypothetical protein EYP09_07730 [Anaerolineae bacterium]|nr:hypothetical protein [Anaerolineae bacterium]
MRVLRSVFGSLLFIALLLSPALAGEPAPKLSTSPMPQGEFKPGEILVKFKGGLAAASVRYILSARGMRVSGEIEELGILRVAVPAGRELEAIESLRHNPLVEYAELNHIVRLPPFEPTQVTAVGQAGQSQAIRAADVVPNDPYYFYQWNLPKIEAPRAWEVTTGDRDIVIAIVDSGIDLDHPDLDGKIWTNPGEIPGNGLDDDGNGYVDDVHGWDFIGEGDSDPDDDTGHGTFIAGIAAAETHNGEGIAGISWGAKLMPVKVMNAVGYYVDIIEGVIYAADNGAKIINMSFGGAAYSPALEDAVNYAHDKGCLLVSTSGYGNTGVPYPGKFPVVVTVAATDKDDQRAWFSNYGPEVDLAAPGVDIASSDRDGIYGLWSSTEVAAPHVAGLAALIWSVNPTLTQEEVEDIMKATAVDLGDPGRDDYYGWGRIDADAAVRTTPHYLRIEPHWLLFLADENNNPPQQAITNPGTSASTWTATETSPWLSVTNPTGHTPSSIEVSVDKSALSGYGIYTASITVSSTMTETQNSPQVITVTLSYVRELYKLYFPQVFRDCFP